MSGRLLSEEESGSWFKAAVGIVEARTVGLVGRRVEAGCRVEEGRVEARPAESGKVEARPAEPGKVEARPAGREVSVKEAIRNAAGKAGEIMERIRAEGGRAEEKVEAERERP